MRIITDDISKYNENWWDNLYSQWTHGEVEHETGHYIKVSELIGRKSTLEVGCGMGHYSKYAKGDYLGIDWSKEAVKKARDLYPEKRFKKALHTDIKEKFGAVVLFEVFEHVENPKKLVEELLTIGNEVYVGIPEGEYSQLWVDKDRDFMDKYNPGAVDYHYAVYNWEDIKTMFQNVEKIPSDDYSIVFKVCKPI